MGGSMLLIVCSSLVLMSTLRIGGRTLCLFVSCAEGARKQSMIELLKSNGGLSYGQNGSHFEPKPVPPPIPKKCDWEIEPAELDFSNAAMIGKGSFGEIVKAYWRGTPVAVKLILPSLSDDRLVIQDFRHEVDLLVKLHHPNIVQFLGVVTKRKPLMLITEYLREGDLHQYLKEKGGLTPATALNFALDIARNHGPDKGDGDQLKSPTVVIDSQLNKKVVAAKQRSSAKGTEHVISPSWRTLENVLCKQASSFSGSKGLSKGLSGAHQGPDRDSFQNFLISSSQRGDDKLNRGRNGKEMDRSPEMMGELQSVVLQQKVASKREEMDKPDKDRMGSTAVLRSKLWEILGKSSKANNEDVNSETPEVVKTKFMLPQR
ncbi:unnamed protein product [Eruca vesicaria subsp. sativa]|uniref:Protein kinase domain-containing protein n=1 Tax=Eruca vesicaria subsp. sativa TaxID=29727 RepID=A0ABC8M396_ERUVS|nr:unnamed protein product [Eruca vesicaria subsp. sativa]